MFAGAIAAVNKNLPYATSVTAPAAIKVMDELPKVHEWEVNQIVALQQELGIDNISSIACSNLLTMVLTSKLFFGEMELPAHYRFTGPVINRRSVNTKFDWYRLKRNSLPKILVSIGTTFDHEHKKSFFAKVIEALGNENLTVVVVSDPALFDQWPPNFIVQSQVPQLELLPHLDAVICHGGHNTVCETLLNGLPMVVIPIAYDQSHVAGRVVRTGAGQRLNFNRFKASHLKEAVYDILQNPDYRANAELLKQSFLDAGGTETAASLLEQISIKQPLEVLKN
jgi:MGT family glycosyltransferase